MICPSFTTTPTMTLECEAAMSDAVLQAARAAMPADPARWFADPKVITSLPVKQRPLVPLLMALLDASESVARAIDDNAWDDGSPTDRRLAEELANQAYRLGALIVNASGAHNSRELSLPSMTGKELV